MLKYNSILVKIKLFYLIVTGKIKKNNDKIVISKDKNIQLSNVCMIFPVDNEDFRVATYTFRNLLKNSNINYHFFINTVHKTHFHLRGSIIEYSYNHKNNKIKIIETFNQSSILNKEYDLVIDLNKSFFYEISIIINSIKSMYKVGIKNQYSDYFYNIQFDLDENSFLENIYEKICEMIK